MKHTLFLLVLILISVATAITSLAQNPSSPRRVRARTPQFNPDDVSRVFFDDLFERLVGERPKSSRGVPSAKGSPSQAAATGGEMVPSGGSSTDTWSQIISATTLEDEIKSLKLDVDKIVTTPSSFAGLGHKSARLDFTLLAMLFAIIDQYDGDVRWQDNAALPRDLFAHTALNLKAGGSMQVFNESKKRKQDLDDLVRGSRLQGTGSDELVWSEVVDRSSMMRLLEQRFESNLKRWTSSDDEFRSHANEMVHEAELTAAVGKVLLSEGMDDADDGDYRPFAEALQRGGMAFAQAAKSSDKDSAQQALVAISRSCVDCHEIYR